MDEMADYTCDIQVTVDGSVLSDYDLLSRLVGTFPHIIRFSIDPGTVLVTAPLAAAAQTERLDIRIYSTSNTNADWHAQSIMTAHEGSGPFTIDWLPAYNVEMWAPPLMGNTGTLGKVNLAWDPALGFYIENRTSDVINGVAILLLT